MTQLLSHYSGLHDVVTRLANSRLAALAAAIVSAWAALLLGPNGMDPGERHAGGIIVGRRHP